MTTIFPSPSVPNSDILSRKTIFRMDDKVPGVLDTSRGFSVRILSDLGFCRYKAVGPILSAWRRAVICDVKENRLYVVRKPLITSSGSGRRREVICGRTRKKVATLKRMDDVGQDCVMVWRGKRTEGLPWLTCQGVLDEHEFRVVEMESGNTLVWTWNERLQQEHPLHWVEDPFESASDGGYYNEIVEGCDAALMLALVIAVDDLYRRSVLPV